MKTAISGSVVQAGAARVAALVAERIAAGADRAASFGPAATGRWAGHSEGGKERGLNPKDGVADQPTLSARRPGAGLVRAAAAGERALLDAQQRQRIVALACGPPPEGRGALDGAPVDRRSGETQTGAAGGTGDDPGPAGKPRPEAVAGKKCGAWRNWMRSILQRWRTSWRSMKSRYSREPVVCLDEKPVVLHQEVRPPLAMRPGRISAAG